MAKKKNAETKQCPR